MIFQVDQEGADTIKRLCDIALKQGGMVNLDSVNKILASVKDLPKEPEKPK